MDSGIAKLFKHGRSQAVRLPLAFRMPGTRVRVTRVRDGILLRPIYDDIDEWFAAMDKTPGHDFMAAGRMQPECPPARVVFD